MRVALYMRRSTNEEMQAESLAIQRDILTGFAALHQHDVTREYEESASGRTDQREAFQQLISDVVSGGCGFEAILVRDVSRWGRFENSDESAFYEFLCLKNGVSVIYVEERFDDDSPYAALIKAMKRVLAAEFSREKSRLVVAGQIRATAQGFWRGGPPPYGMRRVFVFPDGGRQEGPKGVHKLLSNVRTKLAPGDAQEAATVKRIFEEYAGAERTSNEIADGLNADHIPSPRGGLWYPATILKIVSNPAYAGVARFRRRSGTLLQTLAETESSFEAIIDHDLWSAAACRMSSRPRSSRSPEEWQKLVSRALERNGFLSAALLTKYKRDAPRAGGLLPPLQSLPELFHEDIARLRGRVGEALSRRFRIGWDGDILLLNDVVRVVTKFSFRRSAVSGTYFLFDVPLSTPADFVLCISLQDSLTPIALKCVRVFKRDRKIYDRKAGSPESFEQALVRVVRTLDTQFVKTRSFRSAVDSARRPDGTVLPRTLDYTGISRGRVTEFCRTQKIPMIRALPQPERRCVDCGRLLPKSHASNHHLPSSRCQPCYIALPKARKLETLSCVTCGLEREMWPSAAKKMMRPYRCHSCCMAAGRAIRTFRVSEMQRTKHGKLELLHDIAAMLWERMRRTPSRYHRPTVRGLGGEILPQIRWQSPDGSRHCLLLDCDDDFVREAAEQERGGEVTLVDIALDRRYWRPAGVTRTGASRWVLSLTTSTTG